MRPAKTFVAGAAVLAVAMLALPTLAVAQAREEFDPNEVAVTHPADSQRAPVAASRAPHAPLASFSNGPLITNPGAGAGGADISRLQTSVGMNVLGFGAQIANTNSVADDFVVPAGGWKINSITFYAYQTGSTTTSTINDLRVQIWGGGAPNAGGTVVFGDMTTNRLSGTGFSNIYRDSETAPGATNRPIMTATANLGGFLLPAGTYWVEVSFGGTLASGPWAPPTTVVGATSGCNPGPCNGLQNLAGTWNPLLDTGTAATVQDVPFIIDFTAFAKGDLNSDGQPDLVFRSLTNLAQNKVWFMDGVTRTSEAPITPDAAATTWKVRGVDDFDSFTAPGTGGDFLNDLVFWNESTGVVEFWLMNGVDRPGATVPITGAPTLNVAWDLSATGDFNADGKPDLVWRNFTSQKIVIWTMNGTAKLGNIIPTPDQAVNVNWLIVAAADYNNDGNRDFLWYNYTSGKIVTWYMDASVVRTTGQFTTPDAAGNANWKVVASSDYSRAYVPGTPPTGAYDIVWRNETSGNQVVWHLDFNSTRVHGQFTNPASNTPALDWVIVGPR